ncbi:hypothetical protein GCK72_020198 [Caenorhabditis remanei]|uniref:G protein-coupled receptor n=1 Tax=Caenorhabditis remanei TaxID=31234 RepID=A0A6A5GGD5_CAERE|nr:hypothetical protein GCK72_020198 [Caenorhabditis remanei]KAF1753641.1 hypothetical protein GCK72_020198 [Caenorhabditis remanei]
MAPFVQLASTSISLVLNSFLCWLIVEKSPKTLGSYKQLMIYTSVFEMYYAILDLVADVTVFSHEFAVVVFREYVPGGVFNRQFSMILVIAYGVTFGMSMAILASHFVYRYSVTDSKFHHRYTSGKKYFLLFMAPFIYAFWWTCALLYGYLPDIIGGYTTGIMFNVFGVSSHIQMTIQIFLMGIQEVAIFSAFLRKHQSIVTINRRLELKKFVYWGLIVFFHFIMSSFVIFFYFGSITKEQQNSYIKKNLPNLEQVLATFPSLEIYDREVNSLVIVSFGLMILFITLLFVGISVLSFQIFSTLKRHKKTTSNRNINQHRAIFQAIFAQFSVISFCFIPPIFVVILLILEVPNTQGQEDVSDAWIECHQMENVGDSSLVVDCFHSTPNRADEQNDLPESFWTTIWRLLAGVLHEFRHAFVVEVLDVFVGDFAGKRG